MSNPPRRSRPRKPSETIDLTAARIENEPPVPQTGDAPGRSEETDRLVDPEARLTDEASAAVPIEVPGETRADETRAEQTHPLETRAEDTPIPPESVAVLGEPETGDRNAPPAGDGTVAEAGAADLERPDKNLEDMARTDGAGLPAPTAEGRFAAEESLRAERRAENEPHEELDAETILAAAEPQPAEEAPPRPQLDYHTTSSQPAPPNGPSLGAIMGSGLVGGLLALLAGGLLQYAGVIPSVRGQDPQELAQQFARTGDVQQLTTDIANLRNDVGQLQSTLSAGGAGQTGPSSAEFAALADRLNGLEGRLNTVANGDGGQAQPALDPNVLNGVTQAANEARDTAAQARDAANGAGTRADEARQTAATASQAAGTAQQAAEVAQQAASGAMQAADANRQALAEIQSRIGSVEEANRKAAAAISAASLKAAVDRGGPFMGELEAYAKSAGTSPAVDSLRNYAAAGVPTVATLQGEWPDMRAAVLKAVKPQAPDAGVGEQILSGLSGLVAVRPSGSAASPGASGPEATVARLDTALEEENLAGWLAEWEKLPQPAKDASADFKAKVAARGEAERVVGEALAQAVNTSGNPG